MSTQPAAASPSWRWRPWFVGTGIVLGSCMALYTHIFFNFHTVVAGTVFRSAQPGPGVLAEYIRRYHVRTVINLRGSNPDRVWYLEEKGLCRSHGVRLVDLPTDSQTVPNAEEMLQLVRLLDSRAAVPILIHCNWGVERSGALAARCILLLEERDALAKARAQLTWRSGNLPGMQATRTNLAYIDRYERWLVVNRIAHTPAHFRNWALGIARSPHWDRFASRPDGLQNRPTSVQH